MTEDSQFRDHIEYRIPVQVYLDRRHQDIGFIEDFQAPFIRINNTIYNLDYYTFVSRPGY